MNNCVVYLGMEKDTIVISRFDYDEFKRIESLIGKEIQQPVMVIRNNRGSDQGWYSFNNNIEIFTQDEAVISLAKRFDLLEQQHSNLQRSYDDVIKESIGYQNKLDKVTKKWYYKLFN